MNLEKVTYLSIVPNESDKKYQDVDSIIKIGNYTSKNLNFGKKIIYTYKEPTIDPQDFEIKIIDKVPYEDFNNYIPNYKHYAEEVINKAKPIYKAMEWDISSIRTGKLQMKLDEWW